MAAQLYFDFRQPQTIDELCVLIGIPREVLDALSHDEKHVSPIVETAPYVFKLTGPILFAEHNIPKRNARNKGDFRTVWEAYSPYDIAYKTFARRFELFLKQIIPDFPHERAYGYIRGRNTLQNAQLHSGAPTVIHTDIKNFFSSIKRSRLAQVFCELGIASECANSLSRFLTIKEELPLGLPSSPLISNLLAHGIDDFAYKHFAAIGWQYSRYADDIAISGSGVTPDIDALSAVIERSGFELNEAKTHVSKIGQSHFVTGLSVSDSERPRIPKRMKRRLRQELYYSKKYGIVDHLYQIGVPDKLIQHGINRLDGMVRYVGYIEKQSYPKLRREWKDLLDKQKLGVGYESYLKLTGAPVFSFADESLFEWMGKKYMALCIGITKQPDQLRLSTLTRARSFISDPFSDGNVDRIGREGLHFVAATQDLRKNYIEDLQLLPIDFYIAFCEFPPDADYEASFIRLVKKLMPHRLMYYDKAVLDVKFEQNSNISWSKVKKIIDEMRLQQVLLKGRYPLSVQVSTGSKADFPEFSAPDFALGVWNRFAKSDVPKSELPLSRDQLLFERLRDRIRVIVNADNGVVFSRKRPFRPFYQLAAKSLL